VIGVMLMIVVTVIIAAVVSGFAGGMSDTVESNPTSMFEFKIYEKYVGASFYNGREEADPYVVATLKSGETLDTRDLKIISTYEDANGNPVTFTFDPVSNSSQRYTGTGGTSSGGGIGFRSFSGPGTYKNFGVSASYWRQGDLFSGSPGTVIGTTPRTGDIVGIDIVYKPSNMVIWSQGVTVL